MDWCKKGNYILGGILHEGQYEQYDETNAEYAEENGESTRRISSNGI